jgi:hypothetical protein
VTTHPTLADMTVSEFVTAAAAGFGASTARTYQPYWRLLTARHGDTPIAALGLADLELVVGDAVTRARRRNPDTAARAPRESCVTALRALFTRAHAAGLTGTNPAAALTKPRRTRSRRRAVDPNELTELVDAVRTTSRDPDLDLLSSDSTSRPAPAERAPSTSPPATSTRPAPPSGSARRTTPNASSRCRHR